MNRDKCISKKKSSSYERRKWRTNMGRGSLSVLRGWHFLHTAFDSRLFESALSSQHGRASFLLKPKYGHCRSVESQYCHGWRYQLPAERFSSYSQRLYATKFESVE
uniref:Uncharacterized protein n=1 Tax=Parascaris univalens TaxID=6257 RepID=A0A915C9F3_PARUN